MAVLLLASLTACGGDDPPPTPTLSPQTATGLQVFRTNCASCHAVNADTVIVGPSLAGVAASAGSRVSGESAEIYLLTSILRPDAFLVPGFENLMPSTLAKSLSSEEVDAVVAYLLTLD
jgi:mono/diheme cytochrome c family protein